MGLAQQMREREAEVEGRFAEMGDLVVEQHEVLASDEYVLRAVVAVDEHRGVRAGLLDEREQEARRLRHLRGGVEVVRLEAEGLEEGAVAERRLQLLQLLGAPPVDDAEQAPEAL